MYSIFNQQAFYMTNVQRNGPQPLTLTYDMSWKGHVCPTILGANCTNLTANTVSPGQYKIRFSALKHFGDDTDPADFDIYRTPPFNLTY